MNIFFLISINFFTLLIQSRCQKNLSLTVIYKFQSRLHLTDKIVFNIIYGKSRNRHRTLYFTAKHRVNCAIFFTLYKNIA